MPPKQNLHYFPFSFERFACSLYSIFVLQSHSVCMIKRSEDPYCMLATFAFILVIWHLLYLDKIPLHFYCTPGVPKPRAVAHYWAVTYFEPGHVRGGPVHACSSTCASGTPKASLLSFTSGAALTPAHQLIARMAQFPLFPIWYFHCHHSPKHNKQLSPIHRLLFLYASIITWMSSIHTLHFILFIQN